VPDNSKRMSVGSLTYIFEDRTLITITPGTSPRSARHKTRQHMGKPVQKFQGDERICPCALRPPDSRATMARAWVPRLALFLHPGPRLQAVVKVSVDDKQVWHWEGGYLLAPPTN
jgi:hypothetical protein